MRKILLVLSLASLSACSSVSYYAQSIQGQVDILLKREKIEKLIVAPETPVELKKSLQQAIEIRQFASKKLFLPDNKSYLYYADLKRPYVVWNVFAAPEFSLEPKTWCYFVVGCVSYRGYFAQQDAEETAKLLSLEHYDVHVAGIPAYSTLGWLNDPLLNTMMHWSTRSLASLIFHELSHQVVYISGETGFNEAFATAVERLGTIQWLLSTKPESLPNFLEYLKAQQDFRNLLLLAHDELETLYKSSMGAEEKRKRKKEIIEQMKLEYGSLKTAWKFSINFDGWFEQPINNARLTSTMTYLQQVPAFYQLYLENNGDWPMFFESIKDLEEMSSSQRKELIENKILLAPEISTLVKLIQKKSV